MSAGRLNVGLEQAHKASVKLGGLLGQVAEEGIYVLAKRQGDPFCRLAGQFAQQSRHITPKSLKLLSPTKADLKPLQVGFQFWHTLLDLALGQIEIGCWDGIAYNGGWHGFFRFSIRRG